MTRYLLLFLACLALGPAQAQQVPNPATAPIANNILLKASPGGGNGIIRLGFTTAGDGGYARYNWSASNCTAADDGAQVQPPVTGCWIADFSDQQPTPKVWGAVGDGAANDRDAVQAAINAMAGRTLYVGKFVYRLNTGVTANAPLTIKGDGGGGGFYDTSCDRGFRQGANNLNLFTLNGTGYRFENTCIDQAAGVTNTSGAAISTPTGADTVANEQTTIIDRNQINNACIALDLKGGAVQLNNLRAQDNILLPAHNIACIGIRVGFSAASNGIADPHLRDNSIYCGDEASNATAARGIVIYESGGMYLSGASPYGCSYGTVISPGSGQEVYWTFVTGGLGDSSAVNDLLVDAGTSAGIQGLFLIGSWTSYATGSGTTGVVLKALSTGAIRHVNFVGHKQFMYGANQNGIQITGANVIDVNIDASSICSNRDDSGYGIRIENGAGEVNIRNNRIGSCVAVGVTPLGNLAVGVDVAATANAFVGVITGNDFTNTTLPLSVGIANPTLLVNNNMGIDNLSSTVASAATITLSPRDTQFVSGTTTVSTINGGWSGRRVFIIPSTGSVPFATGGNICNAVTGTVNVPIMAFWTTSVSCWSLK